MKFQKLHLENFRKFRRAEFDFGEENLWILCGPNESGKSTVHSALIAGLYGLGAESAGLLKKEDVRPLGSEIAPKIKLEFSINGKAYRLERNLEKGKAKLYHKDLAQEFVPINDDAKKIAEFIAEETGVFGPEVFNKTVSVRQTDISNLHNLDSVSENLEKIFSGGEATLISVEEKFEKLRKKLLRERNEKPGEIDILQSRLAQVSAELQKGELTLLDLAQTDEEYNQLKKLVPEQEERLKTLEELLSAVEKKQTLESKLAMLRRAYKEIKDKIENVKQIEEKIKLANSQQAAKKTPLTNCQAKIIGIAAGILLLSLLSIALTFITKIWIILAVPIIIIAFGIPAILKLRSAKPQSNPVDNVKISELINFKNQLLNGETLDKLSDELTKLEMEGGILNQEINKLPQTSAEEIVAWQREQAKIRETLAENRKRLDDAKIRRAALHAGAIDTARLRGEKEYLKKTIAEKEELLAACRLGQKTLEKIKLTFQKRHLPKLEEKVNELFQYLTQTKRKVSLANSWPKIVVETPEGNHLSGLLSCGALDQLYFSFRLACADLLSQKAKLPIILDDPFVHFDAERRKNACEIVKKIAKERQIIFLTHDEELAKQLSGKLFKLA